MNDSGEKLFKLGTNLAERLREAIVSIEAETEDQYTYRATQFYLFCKSYKSYQAVYRLWKNGFPQDAAILTRTIFEAFLQAKYINEDGERLSRRFIEFDIVKRMNLYTRIKKSGNPKAIEQIDSRPNELKDLKAAYKKIRTQYKGQHWWGEDVGWLARRVKVAPQYNTVAWELSSLIHSDATSMRSYIKSHGPGLAVDCYPSDDRPTTIAVHATSSMLGIVGSVAPAFDAPITKEMDEAVAKFREILEELAND